MGTYKGIQGYTIQTLASDPTVDENVGRLWYNTTSNTWKLVQQVSGAWASGGNLNTSRTTPGGSGTQTATLAFFGGQPGFYPSGATKAVETYDGTSWTNGTYANSERYDGGSIGQLQTDAAYCGGYSAPPPPLQSGKTEIWNGSTWSETGNLVVGRQSFSGGAGTTAAGLVAGSGPANNMGLTEVFDGSTWSEVADLVVPRYEAAVTGLTSTAAMCVGGMNIPAASPYSNGPGSRVGLTEIWDGASWTNVSGTLNLGRIDAGMAGTTTSAVIAGGNTGDPAPPTTPTATAETWDGTSWTTVASMGDANENAGSSSTSANAAITFGGYASGYLATSEEWTNDYDAIKTVTTS